MSSNELIDKSLLVAVSFVSGESAQIGELSFNFYHRIEARMGNETK
jgi:hypothetical protein